MKKLIASALAFVMVGCSTTADLYKAQVEVARYNAQTAQARLQAIQAITANASDTVRIAAAFSLTFDQLTNKQQQVTPVQSEAIQWASILASPLTALGMGYMGMKTNINASNNARDVQLGTMQSMTGMGLQIREGSTYGYQFVNPTPVIAPEPVIVTTPPPAIVDREVVQIPTQVITVPTP
jgi:uncharacterized lipoprotein YmbA